MVFALRIGLIEGAEVSPGQKKFSEVHKDETTYPEYSSDFRRVAALLRHRFGGTDNHRQREWNRD
jgi:hypothetical protein